VTVPFSAGGLDLEMVDGAFDDYTTDRVPELVASPGVERVTWWENAHRDRDDIPRVLDEFSHLVVSEVSPGFVAPTSVPPSVIGAHHFVRTPRPGQGSLSENPTIGLLIVLFSPRDDAQTQELRDWSDFVHIRHIAQAAVPGYTMITPYVNATPDGHPRFLHFYEMDCADPEKSFKMMTPMVEARLGGREYFTYWAFLPIARIMYNNTFRLMGEQARDMERAG
jgi:hypothetical protein